ncbi:MAG TPA: DUF4112 domain-containing protein [Solimonas sp.]|nr:DUF4112 domain-containing protein [Solimonas sp.]
MPQPAPTPAELDAARERIRRLAWLLDSSIAIPGTGWTIGADAVIGLVPVLGDAISAMLGSVIVYEAIRCGAPRALQLRMVGNLGLDTLLGAVPLVGDVFDMAFKSNRRNAELLLGHLDRAAGRVPVLSRRRPVAVVVLAAAAALALGALAWALLHG